MARTRYIKPAFFLDDELSSTISSLGRLVFLGLQNLADFRGCLEWRPMAIKAQVAPFDRIDLERLLKDLIAINRVVRYTVDGREYVKILDFQSLQNPHRQEVEKGSKLPDFPSGIQVEASKVSSTCNEKKSPEISDLQSQQNQPVSGEKFGTGSEPVPPSPSLSLSPSLSPERDASPSAPPAKKATRLPETFLLTAEMRKYAKAKRPDVDVQIETEKFCNYYRAKPGKDATKLDWIRTWRNWILNARVNGPQSGGRNTPITPMPPAYDNEIEFQRMLEAQGGQKDVRD